MLDITCDDSGNITAAYEDDTVGIFSVRVSLPYTPSD